MQENVYKLLEKLQIKYEVVEHPALFTENDNKKYNIKFDFLDCKNLFIRNKDKSKYYLIILQLEKRANLLNLQKELQETRLSFASENDLYEKLKIKSGTVSIFNIVEINNTDVKFMIDTDILKVEKVGFHPNINTLTVVFNPKEITKILQNYNVEYNFVNLS